jgi:hypothetical protein
VGSHYRDVFAPSNDDPVRAGGGLGFVVHDGERVMLKAEAAYGEDLTLFLTSSPLDLFGERHERL